MFALGYILNVAAAGNLDVFNQDGERMPLVQSYKDYKKAIKRHKSNNNLNTRADDRSGWFGWCFDSVAIATGLNANFLGALVEQVIEVPADIAQQWVGAEISAVNVGFGTSENKSILVYITEDLESPDPPTVLEEFTMEKENGWNECKLSTPYKINGKKFYVGCQIKVDSGEDLPLAFDGVLPFTDYSDIMIITLDTGVLMDNVGSFFGSNCIKFEVGGTAMPDYEIYPMDLYVTPMVEVNHPFQAQIMLMNIGLEGITGADVEVKVNGKVSDEVKVTILGEGSTNPDAKPEDDDANNMIPFGTYGFILLDGMASDNAGDIPVEISIKGVSGSKGSSNWDSFIQVKSSILVPDNIFPRTVVMEEFTGTWCQACPAGIVGMDYMEETYGDDNYIGIVAHYGPANSSSPDPMFTQSYYDVIYQFSGGQFPSGVMNRTESVYPDKEDLVEAYESIYKFSEAKVSLEVGDFDAENRTLQAKSITEFGFSSPNQTYAVAFVLTENNVGPYIQTNGFAGTDADMGGWQNKPVSVPWYFDHVARDIFLPWGIQESAMTTVELGKQYEFNITLPLDNVTSLSNTDVIVLLLNYTTGEIVNAAKVKLKDQAGVEGIIADPEEGVYKVYNLQGVKVLETKDASQIKNLDKGIYVVNGKKVAL